jgi:protein-S-isoprenylcysteine O-methyltransferase Ste14
MSEETTPKASSMQSWGKIARRIRVPLGFVTAALYVYELWRQAPSPAAVAWSLLLVVPGVWLRAYASGYVKKNAELTVTGPYAHTRNPLYLGSMMMAAGFVVALQSWLLAAVLAAGFAVIYIPTIASEERFLRSAFANFDEYARRVPRLLPRLTPAQMPASQPVTDGSAPDSSASKGSFSFTLYLQHREYNAAIGAALLYICLVGLRPLVAVLVHGAR